MPNKKTILSKVEVVASTMTKGTRIGAKSTKKGAQGAWSFIKEFTSAVKAGAKAGWKAAE